MKQRKVRVRGHSKSPQSLPKLVLVLVQTEYLTVSLELTDRLLIDSGGCNRHDKAELPVYT